MRAKLWLLHCMLCLLASVSFTAAARAQGVDPANRPISQINIQGLVEVSDQLVRNQIRSEVGEPYNPRTVEQDIVRITHLGRFSAVKASVQSAPDGSVGLTFIVQEQPLLADVQTVGNKAISDQELLSSVLLRSGDPVDSFLIERGIQRIEDLYEDKGFFVADVTVDEELLEESNILIYRVREGPKVRIRGIRYQGNTTYTDKQLQAQIKSKPAFPIFRSGDLSREQLELDAASIRQFYQDRGYLDAQVGRRIELSPDQRSAVVVFVIEEGTQYLVDSVRVEGAQLFAHEQILLNMALRQGDVYSEDKVRRSIDSLRQMYGSLGFLSTSIQIERLFHSDQPRVDAVVKIDEGNASLVGTVSIRGNDLTRDKVILRQVRGMTPGRPFDRNGVEKTRRRLNETPLFDESTVTILGEPTDEVRDVLIEVKERNTGSINLGAGVSSDVGVIGAIDVIQRNFDITDLPESATELVTGRAFRGAGQYFALTLQPGNEASRYAINFREPYLLETDYFLDTSLFYFTREREDWDEQRVGAAFGIGQRFGDVWSASIRARVNQVDISNIEPDVPVDVFAVEGDSILTGLGFTVERNTTDSIIFPTRGSKSEFGIERVGALGGDYDFTTLSGSYRQFWTVDEDFFGRKTVISARVEAGYILEDGEAPVFERFYAGGHRSFRGFSYRGVGPRGIRNDTGLLGDDPVGGEWLLLGGAQYNFPVLGDTLRGVLFTDMGTVQEDIGVDDWRVSVGTGVRIKIPFLGQAPFALDFAIPVLKQSGDDTQLVSFDLSLPLQ